MPISPYELDISITMMEYIEHRIALNIPQPVDHLQEVGWTSDANWNTLCGKWCEVMRYNDLGAVTLWGVRLNISIMITTSSNSI